MVGTYAITDVLRKCWKLHYKQLEALNACIQAFAEYVHDVVELTCCAALPDAEDEITEPARVYAGKVTGYRVIYRFESP